MLQVRREPTAPPDGGAADVRVAAVALGWPAPSRARGARRTMDPGDRLTRLLAEGGASGEVFPLVYDELRALAQRRMSKERGDHTLQATALVNEAWMRLAKDADVDWQGRRHFFGAAAEAMRRILVDHARRAGADKRGGGMARVTLGAGDVAQELEEDRASAIAEALGRLESEDPAAAEVTKLRFLCGLTAAETAAAMGISERSVHREWAFARARLFELIDG
ncbi:MAG: ECF-type sigma factor [Planctomycetota bacterium]